ncbi:hypothetical protein ACHMW4_04275 [Mesorhizobium sp. UC22_110]|uniref:hypothetical protein n=1 Tax=unclassified Mesorhizobium TaxID=325217 RepID=UPI0036702439
METLLKDLCAKHGLTSISAMIFMEFDRLPMTVYVHWNGDDGRCECAGRNGNTFDEAFELALHTMAERRTPRAA